MSKDSYQEDALLRLPQVLQLIPVSKSHWWQGVRAGKYPAGFKLSERVRVWPFKDIRALINREAA